MVRVVRREKDLVWPLERGHRVARREGDSRRSDLILWSTMIAFAKIFIERKLTGKKKHRGAPLPPLLRK